MENRLDIEAIAKVYDDIAYGSGSSFNGLFEISLSTGNCKYIGMFPHEDPGKKRLHVNAACVGSKIYFAPYAGEYISIYDTEKQQFKSLGIKAVNKEQYRFFHDNWKFGNILSYQNYIYFICCTYPAICKMDVLTEEIQYIDDWLPEEGYCFSKDVCIKNNIAYFTSVNNNILMKLELGVDKITLYHLGDDKSRSYWSGCIINEDIWFAPRKEGPIIKWNENTHTVEEISDYPKEFRKSDFLFTKIYKNDEALFLLPAHTNMMIEISITERKMRKSRLLNDKSLIKCACMFQLNNQIGLKVFERKGEQEEISYLKLDCENNTIKPYELIFDSGQVVFLEEHWKSISLDEDSIFAKEKRCWGLSEFLLFIQNKK